MEDIKINNVKKGKYCYNNNEAYREYHKAFMTAPFLCELCNKSYMRCNYYRHLKTKKHKQIEELLKKQLIKDEDEHKI